MNTHVTDKQGEQLGKSIISIMEMDFNQKRELTNEIIERQPILLREVMSLADSGIPGEKIESLIELLLIFYDYFYSDKTELPLVTEKIIEEVKANLNAFFEWTKKEDPEEMGRLLVKSIKGYPEIFALHFLNHHMKTCGFFDPIPGNDICLKAARVILDGFVRVKKEMAEKMV